MSRYSLQLKEIEAEQPEGWSITAAYQTGNSWNRQFFRYSTRNKSSHGNNFPKQVVCMEQQQAYMIEITSAVY